MFGVLGWIITFIVVILIIAIVYGIVIFATKYQSQSPNPSEFFVSQAPLLWSNGTPVSGERGVCSLYTYPGSTVTIEGNQYFQPPTPSLALNLVNSLNPQSAEVGCLDTDQQIAAQLTHVCQGITGQSSLCITYNGTFAQVGQTETYYSGQNCTPVGICYGALGFFGVNFHGATPSGLCAEVDSSNILKAKTCDPTNVNQLFRISRVNPGTEPPLTINPSQPQTSSTGNLAQFYSRIQQMCANPISNVSGSQITLGNCTNPYSWALIPSFGSTMGNAPQQIAYVAGATGSIPNFDDGDEIATWITTNNILALSFSGDNLILAPYSFNDSSSTGKAQTAQYVNYISFSSEITTPVCSANTVTDCSSF